MNLPRLKKQLALPTLATVLFALALYVVYVLAPIAIAAPGEAAGMEEPAIYGWLRLLAKPATWLLLLQIALSISLAVIFVRAFGETIFYVFRQRKGYEAPSLTRDIFALVAYVILIALILHYFTGVSFGALLPGSALLGVILGLALQDTLGNLFAGISLHADKPFQVGDVITVGPWSGTVESVTWRAVKIKTFQNHFVLVSNSSIAKEYIEVCPRGNPNARIVFFNAVYGDSPAKVIHVVREAVRDTDNVLRYMTPVVRIRQLADSGVDYEVKYWLNDYARYNDTDALVRQRIWYAFRRNGLNFAFPTQTLFLHRATDGQPPDTDSLSERLAAVDIFSPLSPEELKTLVENAKGRVFAPGELIIRAGDPGSSMFVVHSGSVEVRVDSNGQVKTINTLREGDFFGEMALFTGEPRTAHVIAADETEVIEIGHTAMKRLFDTNPGLVESLSHTINERRAVLAAKTNPPSQIEEEEKKTLLRKIQSFFGLGN